MREIGAGGGGWYRRALNWTLDPADVLRLVRDDPYPVALIGDWAGGGAVIGSRPLLVREPPGQLADVLDQPFPATGAPPAGFGGGWIGYLGYGAGHGWLNIPPPPGGPRQLPDWWFGFYDHVLRLDGRSGRWFFEALRIPERDESAVAAIFHRIERKGQHGGRLAAFRCGDFAVIPPEPEHKQAVRRAVGLIRDGDIFQANICLRLEAGFSGDPLDLFCQGVTRLRPPFAAFLRPAGGAVASLSPELFLRRTGRDLLSQPIKGTVRRSADAPLAAEQLRALEASAKNRAENVMIVDLMRNDLGRVCETGSVAVPRLLHAQPHPGVWHLVSDVTGTLRAGCGDGDLIRATFPPGSITGAPKVRAMEVVHELEAVPREVYTGAIGYRSPLAGLELNVAIRTFEFSGDRVWLGAGGGIVADSQAGDEFRECLIKAGPLIRAVGGRLARRSGRGRRSGSADDGLPGRATESPGERPAPQIPRSLRPRPAAGVFTSLLVESGAVRDLDVHLDRLEASAAGLFGKHLPRSLGDDLAACLAARPSGRLRITVRPAGGPLRARIEVVPLEPAAPRAAPEPAASGPAPEPVGARPVAPEPVTPEPVTPEPVGPEPAGARPVGPEPAGPRPVGPEPAGPRPVGPEPAGPRPVGPEPVGLWPAIVPGGLGAHKWADRRLLAELARDLPAPGDQVLIEDTTGEILETDRASVFAVTGGVLRTPPADGRILPGVTRAAVLRAAATAGFPVVIAPLTRADLTAASEVFLTNAVRGVLPVSTIAARPVAGADGPVASRVANWLATRPASAAPGRAIRWPPRRSPGVAAGGSPGRPASRADAAPRGLAGPQVVLIDNYDSFTYNLAQLLLASGCQVDVVRNDEITPTELVRSRPAGIVISPGPCAPPEAGASVDVVRACAGTTPLLGICLGHQVIAAAFGARIIRAPEPVHGRTSAIVHDGRGVFAGLPQGFQATRYHSLIVDEATLPGLLPVTARTLDGIPMALRHRSLPVEGVQFHPESILTGPGAALIGNFVALLHRRPELGGHGNLGTVLRVYGSTYTVDHELDYHARLSQAAHIRAGPALVRMAHGTYRAIAGGHGASRIGAGRLPGHRGPDRLRPGRQYLLDHAHRHRAQAAHQ